MNEVAEPGLLPNAVTTATTAVGSPVALPSTGTVVVGVDCKPSPWACLSMEISARTRRE